MSSFLLPSVWVCCLSDPERTALRSMSLAYVAGLGNPVPVTVWESFWGFTVLSRGDRQAVVVSYYHLEYTDFLDSDTDVLVPSVGYTDTVFWAELVAFFISPAGACLDGCGDWFPP